MAFAQKDFDLTDKVAIVTGGTKGIGLAISHSLAEHGASVVVSSRKEVSVQTAAQEMRGLGLETTAIAAHMGDPQQIEALVTRTVDTYGGVDILVNNAATNPVYGPLLETDDRVFDKIIDVNLRGPLELAKRVHPIMAERGGGSIINMSSVAGISPEKGLGLYNMSKAALISLTKVMAQEWGGDGIRANAICPGLIKTNFSTALWEDEKVLASLEKKLPAGRIGAPEDVAGIAVFLAAPASSYCTGAVFTIDGGALI